MGKGAGFKSASSKMNITVYFSLSFRPKFLPNSSPPLYILKAVKLRFSIPWLHLLLLDIPRARVLSKTYVEEMTLLQQSLTWFSLLQCVPLEADFSFAVF